MSALIFLTLLLSFPAFALEINPQLGNVTYASVDCISRTGKKQLYVERFYNSSAKQVGWFGFAQGTQFETYLYKELDGTLSVHEFGQTPARMFRPKTEVVNTDEMVRLIMEKKEKSLNSAAQLIFKEKLLRDRSFRAETARQLNLRALPKEGEVFVSKDFNGETIEFKKNQFRRSYVDGRVEVFSSEGRLNEVSDPRKGQTINLTYDSQGLVTTIRDNFLNQLSLTWSNDRKVVAITSVVDGKQSKFSYENGFLTKVINQQGDVYEYEYDNRKNLTALTAPASKNPTVIKYDLKTRVPVSVTAPNGTRTDYVFQKTSTAAGGTSSTILKRHSAGGKLEETLSWKYEFKLDDLGDRRLLKASHHDGISEVETLYRDCCYPQPEKIAMGATSVTFSYDTENRLVLKKYSSGKELKISYDNYGHVSEVVANGVPFRYRHDPKTLELLEMQGPGYRMKLTRGEGVLKQMEYTQKDDQKGHVVNYFYDEKKRLLGIQHDKKTLIKYSYNDDEQTTEIVGADKTASQKQLEQIDQMMIEAMLLREVNYAL
jgi:YD repeat-containing protein